MTDGWRIYRWKGLGPEEWKGYFIYHSGASRELGGIKENGLGVVGLFERFGSCPSLADPTEAAGGMGAWRCLAARGLAEAEESSN